MHRVVTVLLPALASLSVSLVAPAQARLPAGGPAVGKGGKGGQEPFDIRTPAAMLGERGSGTFCV
jgi:hypothetical protein